MPKEAKFSKASFNCICIYLPDLKSSVVGHECVFILMNIVFVRNSACVIFESTMNYSRNASKYPSQTLEFADSSVSIGVVSAATSSGIRSVP